MTEFTKEKQFYIIFMAVLLGIMGFGYIGATESIKTVLQIYLFILAPTFLFIFVIDLFTDKEFQYIDTVTIDKPFLGFINLPINIVLGILVTVFIGYSIVQSGVGLVSAPQFQIFNGVYGNSLLSGLVGIIENWVFFGFVFPTARKIFEIPLQSTIPAVFLALIITIGIFTGYHFWVYGLNQAALMSVAIFTIINVASVFLTGSLIISDMIHFTNNVIVTSGYAKQIVFAVVG